MKRLSAISKKKEEPLLPQTIEGDPEKVGKKDVAKAKGIPSTTKKTQKKLWKGFRDGVATVLFFMVCLAPGKSLTLLLKVGFYLHF